MNGQWMKIQKLPEEWWLWWWHRPRVFPLVATVTFNLLLLLFWPNENLFFSRSATLWLTKKMPLLLFLLLIFLFPMSPGLTFLLTLFESFTVSLMCFMAALLLWNGCLCLKQLGNCHKKVETCSSLVVYKISKHNIRAK